MRCLQGICNNYVVRRVTCSDLGDAGHGVYVIISGSEYLIGYSRDLGRRLRMYCSGRLDVYGVVRLLMGRLDDLGGKVLVGGGVVDRRRELTKVVREVMSNAQILTIKCGSMTDKELYVRLRDCLARGSMTPWSA